MIIAENSMSQKVNGSPAQICADASDLAAVLFGSNSSMCCWCVKFCEINSLAEGFGPSMGFEFPASVHTHTHTHAHTQ